MNATGRLTIKLYDSKRAKGGKAQFFSERQALVTLRDGFGRQVHRHHHKGNMFTFTIPLADNLRDDYTVLAWASGRKDAGRLPVRVSKEEPQFVRLMLLRKTAKFKFRDLRKIKRTHPRIFKLLKERDPSSRYEDWRANNRPGLAMMLNILDAIAKMRDGVGKSMLDYYQRILWNCPHEDRFYALADPSLKEVLKAQRASFSPAPSFLHGSAGVAHIDDSGDRMSYKEIVYDEANVQFTLHASYDESRIVVENDIDYHKDPASHLFLEVIPNMASNLIPGHRRVTDPKTVFALRWMQEMNAAGEEEPTKVTFNPPMDLL